MPNRSLRPTLPAVVVLLCTAASALYAESLRVTIREPAGIQRRSYPVHGQLRLPQPVAATTKFRLLRDGKPVVAQFRPLRTADGKIDRWWLDFATSLQPNERRAYRVEYGADVAAGPERRSGHVLTRAQSNFVVANKPYIDWVVPGDLRGFLRSVDFRPNQHLRPDSAGLLLRDRAGKTHSLGGPGTRAQVVREGRMTVALRFQRTESVAALSGVRWTVDLVFPGPVSWVEYRVRLHDPKQRVSELGLQLNVNLQPSTSRSPTIVDLGASRTVYARLSPKELIELRSEAIASGRHWSVHRGLPLRPFVLPPAVAGPAEGWAHLMDREQCLAIAFHRFGSALGERIRIRGDGQLSAWKTFRRDHQGEKHWRGWLHFVFVPPQASATADPQQMQAPIEFQQVNK